VSDVRTSPVEYSEVMISVPNTAMMNWPRMASPRMVFWGPSKPERSCADMCGHWCTVPRQ
jgi:hypothetical protein